MISRILFKELRGSPVRLNQKELIDDDLLEQENLLLSNEILNYYRSDLPLDYRKTRSV